MRMELKFQILVLRIIFIDKKPKTMPYSQCVSKVFYNIMLSLPSFLILIFVKTTQMKWKVTSSTSLLGIFKSIFAHSTNISTAVSV